MAELVVKRYATALFDMASDGGAVAQYETEVTTIVEALKETPDFMAVLENHKVTMEEKVTLIDNIFSDRVQAPIIGLMVLMVKKSRQGYILEVLEDFIEMAKEARGIMKASVTSVVPLREEQLEQIKAKLQAGTGKVIELETIIDESIIAGLIIRVGDKVIDASVQGEMATLKKQLSELRLA